MKQTFFRPSQLSRFVGHTAACLISLCLSIPAAQAAGLGKMKVMSALGAPFKAEVELSNIRPEEEVNLIVKVASPDVFKQAGIDYNPALAGVRAVLSKEGNPPKIVLTSSSAVNEPLLEMLIELNWQSGRLVRQYTVLLDPATSLVETPAQTEEPRLPAQQVVTAALAQQPQTSMAQPVATPTSAASSTEPQNANKPKQPSADKVYNVKSGDTLYGIASRLNSGDASQTKALMALLFKNNQQAFIGNNINKLKAGVVLSTDNNVSSDTLGRAALAASNNAPTKAFSQYKQAAVNKVKPIQALKDDKKSITSAVKPVAKAETPVSAQDQLKVSGNATVGNKSNTVTSQASEEKISKDRAIAEEKSRLAELQKLG
jgi:pilus assembly protein FimV